MSIKENLQNLFRSEPFPASEVILEAQNKEKAATVEYLEGRMSLDDYKTLLDSTFPITKLDLRKLASSLNR